jgi:type VI secretion system secreted protein VgrG
MPNIGDTHRGVKIHTPLGEGVLVIHKFEGRERLGRLFEFELELRSENEAIPLKDLLGKNVTVELELHEDKSRFFNGFITDFSYQGTIGNLASYRASGHHQAGVPG